MSFYNNPEFDSKVNDFGDDYHLPEEETEEKDKELLIKLRSLKRRYRDPYEYADAKRIYINYTTDLIDQYGGKKRFYQMWKLGLVKEYIPFCPELRKTKKNSWFWKDGLPLASKIEVEYNCPPYKISNNPYVDFSYKKTKDAYLYKGVIETTTADKIEDELKIIGEYYKGRVKHPTRLSKKAHKRRLLAERYRKDQNYGKSITERMEEYMEKKFLNIYDTDEDKDNDGYVFYKDALISKDEVEEIEAYELLKSLGLKVSRSQLSKKSRKVVRRKKIKFGKGKKGKKKNKKNKYLSDFTDGRYNSYEDFEREMLELTTRDLMGE